MVSEHDADDGTSRRRMLAALGAASTATLAGCMGVLSDDESEPSDDTTTTEDGGTETDDATNGPVEWPAIEAGEVLSDFENLDAWSASTGKISAAPDEARLGSQAAVVESQEATANMKIEFDDAIDLQNWDVSLAVKPESAERVRVQFFAPNRSARLGSTRIVPDDFDGWFRLDCGTQQKPGGDPDMSNVTAINVIADGPDGGPTKLLVDDLRRTKSAADGAVILAFQGGYQSHYEQAAEMLKEREWSAAVPIDPEQIGSGGRMGASELSDLQERGWDICPVPQSSLPEQSGDEQRQAMESVRDAMVEEGFEDGARHLFVPDGAMDPSAYGHAREVYESTFLYNSGNTSVPPTEMHMVPYIWGPALHTGVRRHVNHSDQYNFLTVVRIPEIVDEDDVGVNENRMSLDDFGLLVDHIDHRGLDIITPSALVDEEFERATDGNQTDDRKRPTGTILEKGQTHSFEGSGSKESPRFDLDEGVLVANVEYDGDEITIGVTKPDKTGRNENLMTTSGTDQGTSIMAVEDDTYQLEVETAGEWSVELTQPEVRSDDLQNLPFEASGTGSGYVGPLWTKGVIRVVGSHEGDGPFIVEGYGANGSREIIVHREGEFNNSRSYRAGGPVWLNVEADGDWTLEVVDS